MTAVEAEGTLRTSPGTVCWFSFGEGYGTGCLIIPISPLAATSSALTTAFYCASTVHRCASSSVAFSTVAGFQADPGVRSVSSSDAALDEANVLLVKNSIQGPFQHEHFFLLSAPW